MGPSTATPTDLHRAPVACLQCRKAKVRCLVSQRLDRCNRCITNGSDCVFSQPKRARARVHPYPQRLRHDTGPVEDDDQDPLEERVSSTGWNGPLPPELSDEAISTHRPLISASHTAQQQQQHHQQPVITSAIRARIIEALATLKGKRGAPFSFVTSGDSPSFSTRAEDNSARQRPPQQQRTPRSLKLSWLLRPLPVGIHQKSGDDDWRPAGSVKMPSYLSSMTLGQTIIDPIEGGMISVQGSKALFEFFMIHMNAKWEYILDPHVDTHDNVERQSSLLFASILFCASKFANYVDGHVVAASDPFLQTRLCSLARNLVIKTLAEGDRSIETMQALYLLVCWKDADDDISYLHSGYAFRLLHDLDLDHSYGDARQVARRRRTWTALFRQDRQQSLFFMRRASLCQSDDNMSFGGDLDIWLQMPHALPLDFVACCSADLRRVQSNLRIMVKKASSTMMLPCLLELMDAELSTWKSKWRSHLEGEGRTQSNDGHTISTALLHPGRHHLTVLVGLWEHSVRLNVASAILRKALMASVTTPLDSDHQTSNAPLDLDITTLQQVLSPDLPGLRNSVEGAFGTLQHMLNFPPDDLRRAPDAVILLAPNASLFLCLLLCLPGNGIIGPAFQRTAVDLIKTIGQHVKQAVKSPQDTVALHSAYLESLVELLNPSSSHISTDQQTARPHPIPDMAVGPSGVDLDEASLQAAQVLVDGMGGNNCGLANDTVFPLAGDPSQNLHMQGLANLLDGDLFWEIPPGESDVGIDT